MKKTMRKFKETVEIQSSFFNRIRSHRFFSVGVFISILLFALCFHIWQRVKVIELAKVNDHLKAENRQLTDLVKKTYVRISSLEMGSRIEQYARDSLGMEMVSPDRLFTLERTEARPSKQDEMATLSAAFRRVAKYLPVVSPTSARAKELRSVDIDTLRGGSGR